MNTFCNIIIIIIIIIITTTTTTTTILFYYGTWGTFSLLVFCPVEWSAVEILASFITYPLFCFEFFFLRQCELEVNVEVVSIDGW
jgi:hypothetical protein